MRSFFLALVIASPASATTLDTPKLERLLGLGFTKPPPPPAPSPLPWRLLGTLRGRDVSFAAVECSAKSVTLSVGDVRDGVEVIAIERQVLIVRRNGRLEEVGWKVGVPTLAALPTARVVSRQLVNQVLGNPAQILTEIRMIPAMVGGRLSGFKAHWVKEGSFIAGLGLKAGDVIVGVNGMRLDSFERMGSLFQLLTNTSRFDVELERNGQHIIESVELGN